MGFAVGESIGPYKITQYIGQGGMATIYRAYQPALDRDVALKVIHPALKEDQAFLARLRREAAIVARLNHPNIVDVYDYAIAETDGTPYIVMRYIEGKTLKDVVQERKLSPQEILNIIRPVADALAYAHAHGVLHRDVKLSNIMLDHEGNVFLTDFGLARLTYKGESTLSHDMLIGSPQYISPEMAKGDPIDARTDVYSLGVVLFEMFAGRLPFQAETPYATVMAHINDPVPNARQFNKNIPPAVDFVLQRALAKKPEQRFGSVDELMRALENAVRGP
ncbi:MAG: serine/threonine protein kinase, partial [Chloroflexi bacterium]|nr:serine/threonine protein kinase [Chloroflexota bacterium]